MADEGERNRLVAEFSGVTDVDAERAQFYLESAGWDLHVSFVFWFLWIVATLHMLYVYYELWYHFLFRSVHASLIVKFVWAFSLKLAISSFYDTMGEGEDSFLTRNEPPEEEEQVSCEENYECKLSFNLLNWHCWQLMKGVPDALISIKSA